MIFTETMNEHHDPTSQSQLDSILKKLGVQKEDNGSRGNKDTLGQSDFLKLMTTQLQNQDPFAPMENAEFIAQMAQFSTVTGITEMGAELKGIADQLGEFRIATAANLLGNSVRSRAITRALMKMVKSMGCWICRRRQARQTLRSATKLVMYCTNTAWPAGVRPRWLCLE